MDLNMTKILINTVEAKEQFADLVNRVAHSKEKIILTRRGKEIVAMIPVEDLLLLQQSQDKHDLREAIDSLKDVRHLGAMTLDELREKIGI
jgi:prevent-host-death family protein